mgnify:CR=1 FL=1|tara:strand:- start:368 stop:715 length:348 start_codon:yes stop_codon:yes gene_type:complete
MTEEKYILIPDDFEYDVTSIYFPFYFSYRKRGDGYFRKTIVEDPLTLYFYNDYDYGTIIYQSSLSNAFDEIMDKTQYEPKELKKGVHIKLLSIMRDALQEQLDKIDEKLNEWKQT